MSNSPSFPTAADIPAVPESHETPRSEVHSEQPFSQERLQSAGDFPADGGSGFGSCNVGTEEQRWRVGVGTAMLAAAALVPLPRGWKIGLAAAGAAALVTGAVGYCPISQAIGRNTCKR